MRRVHVLHLVDEEVPGAPADGVGELAVARQRVGTGHDQVVEVEQAAPAPLRLVAGERVRHLFRADAAAAMVPAGLGLVALRRDEPRLGPPDFAVEGAGPAGVARRHLGQQASPVRQSWGSGRPRSSRCSRSRPSAVRWKVPAFTPDTPSE